MKKWLFFFLMLFAFSFIFSQKATISISHTVTYDSISVLPDSILITNMTQGGDTTLYGSDTTLVLDYTVGMNEYQINHDDFIVKPNYPNPFKEQTNFDVILPGAGHLVIKVYDVVSRELANFSASYPSGKHEFLFTGGKEGLYIINVAYNNKMSSIKIYSLGDGNNQSCEIIHISSSASLTNKLVKSINSFGYTFGDQLRSIVFYQALTDTTVYIPTQDTIIQIGFQSPTSCPSSFTDTRDNHVYSAVQIGTQCWMSENLAYLPSVSPSGSGSDTIPYYYVYGYQGTDVNAAKATSNYQTYGVVYNWPAAMAGEASSDSVPSGVQGICLNGWHLPSDEEWKIIEGEVDSQYVYPDLEWDGTGWRGTDAGGNLKETGTTHWYSPNTGATNSSDFTALPGGYRGYYGSFLKVGDYAYFWSSTGGNTSYAWSRGLTYNSASVSRYGYYNDGGFSVRCLRD